MDAAAQADVPGTTAGKRPTARTRNVALSPTGRCWAAATTEGLLLYSLDEDLVFDPTDLTEDLTPEACHRALSSKSYVRALLIALRLGDRGLLRHCVFSTPAQQVPTVAATLPAAFVPQVLTSLSELVGESAHLEFLLMWVRGVCVSHGVQLEGAGPSVMPALRSLQKVLNRLHEDLSTACEGNMYTLEYVIQAGRQQQQQQQQEQEAQEAGAGAQEVPGGGAMDPEEESGKAVKGKGAARQDGKKIKKAGDASARKQAAGGEVQGRSAAGLKNKKGAVKA